MDRTTTPDAPAQAETLHPLIQEEINSLQGRIDRVRTMGPQLDIAQELEKRFPESYMRKTFDLWAFELNVAFQFKAMADAAKVLRFLAEEKGLHLLGKPSKSEEANLMYWRLPRFCILGYFTSSEADACKFVQVGTKTVPVYELRCGDKPAEAPKQPYPEGMSEADVRSAEAELGVPF